ncbi:MAG: twin-arginine translocase TatA/TatE family subunit [Acidobacteriota bacterium]
MFGPLGFWEVLFIVVLALLIFGPKKLPEVGRTVGRGMSEFRKATSDLKRTIEHEINLEESQATIEGPRPVESAVSRTDHRGSGSVTQQAAEAAEAAQAAASQDEESGEPAKDD